MSNLSRNCFTYFLKITQKDGDVLWYYGSRTRNGCHPGQLGTTYPTSSKHVHLCLKGDNVVEWFVHKIFGEDAEACKAYEADIIDWLLAHKSPLWLNKHNPKRVSGCPFGDVQMTEERKNNISKAKKGISLSLDHRSNLSKAKAGVSQSLERRERQSKRQKGVSRKPFSDEWKANLRVKKGPMSDTGRENVSLGLLGNKRTAKAYKFISPEGVKHEGLSITELCREQKLNVSHMCRVLRGLAPHHKNWRLADDYLP